MRKVKVIGLCGAKGAGKDSVFKILDRITSGGPTSRSVVRFALGDKVKVDYADLHGLSLAEVETNKSFHRKGLQNHGFWRRTSSSLDYWINFIRDGVESCLEDEAPVATITDIRHDNELDWAWGLGGVMVRINRPEVYDDDPDVSEQLYKRIVPDYEIDNSGTEENLEMEVRKLAIKLGLIEDPGAVEMVAGIPRDKLAGSQFIEGPHEFCPASLEQIISLSTSRDIEYRPRPEAEKDESFLQLIPYVLLRKETPTGYSYLTYRRTKQGGEGRLQGLCSIGLGGHVNIDDGSVLDGMKRELVEELGMNPSRFAKSITPVGTIYDKSTEVGRVHLGLLYVIDVHDHVSSDDFRPDPSTELIGFCSSETGELEGWSRIAKRYEQSVALCAINNHKWQEMFKGWQERSLSLFGRMS